MMYVDPSGHDAVWIRDMATKYHFGLDWEEKSKSAILTSPTGFKFVFTTTIIDGKMYIDEDHFLYATGLKAPSNFNDVIAATRKTQAITKSSVAKNQTNDTNVNKGTGNTSEMKVSDSLINFLSDYEKFMPNSYYATQEEKKKGIKTIGFGHVIQPGENFDNGITLEQAKKLLKKDLSSREETVRNLTKGVSINQQQFDALVDFQFNTGNLASSDLLKHVKSGNATNEQLLKDFLSWTRQGSNHLINLYQRRYDEWEIFTNGEYQRNEKRKAPAGYI